MKSRKYLKKIIAMVLIAAVLLTTTGCDGSEIMNYMMDKLGTTVTPGARLLGSGWINSDLIGAIDENTEIDLKDDFHTVVNRDWLLETEVGEEGSVSFLGSMETIMEEQLLEIFIPGKEYVPDEKIMSQQAYAHMEQLILDLMELAGNEEKRNALGAEPLRPYLEAIEGIDSLEEMTAYLCNESENNFLQETLLNCFIDVPISSRGYYTVHISPCENLLLRSSESYSTLPGWEYYELREKEESLRKVLVKLGYSEKEAAALFNECYWFEAKLAAELPWSHEQSSMDYLGYADNQYNLDQLAELQGNFPLTELLQFWGMDESEYYIVYEPSFVRYLGKIYNEKNLEAMKAYFIVHTALEALMYLDVESAEDAAVLMQADNEDETMGEEEEPGEEIEINSQLSEEEEQILEIASTYLFPNLIDAIQQVYIGRHFSSQMREEVLALVEDIKEYYIELLKNTEWLGPETREEGIRKLNNMYVHVFYPDVLTDYSGLDYLNYEEGGNLLDAIYDIRTFNFTPESEKINQAVDRGEWDLSSVNTLASNAYYMLMNNSVYILAGIAAGGITYGLDSPLEQNYARLGMIIGHEITHAFDNSGYNFDADGLENKWWTSEDEVAFRMKADRLANHYGTLSFLPGVEGGYDGTIVQGEAIADMGGMKCMLALAEDIPDFDYEKFFISYANLFCYKTDLGSEMQLAMDVHPLGFLRTNVTVQQFDEFFETFDIGPGDGMYLAPEDRIMVW